MTLAKWMDQLYDLDEREQATPLHERNIEFFISGYESGTSPEQFMLRIAPTAMGSVPSSFGYGSTLPRAPGAVKHVPARNSVLSNRNRSIPEKLFGLGSY
jgi:hypothetical protein